jgi:hypothetical protein
VCDVEIYSSQSSSQNPTVLEVKFPSFPNDLGGGQDQRRLLADRRQLERRRKTTVPTPEHSDDESHAPIDKMGPETKEMNVR